MPSTSNPTENMKVEIKGRENIGKGEAGEFDRFAKLTKSLLSVSKDELEGQLPAPRAKKASS